MRDLTIHDWIIDELRSYDRGHPANFLSASLQLAVLQLVTAGLSRNADEETYTGALLGAFCSTSFFCASGFPRKAGPDMCWQRHNKNSKDRDGEKHTGADFTLIVRTKENFARAAVFQAKNAKSEIGSFEVDHVSPATDKRPAEQQIVRLVDHCISIMAEITKVRAEEQSQSAPLVPSLEGLEWAHYLVYHDYSNACCQVSNLRNSYDTARAKSVPGRVRLKEANAIPLVDLLAAGCSEDTDAVQGWISLESLKEIRAFTKHARQFFDVYESRTDPDADWKPVSSLAITSNRNERKAMVRKGFMVPECQESRLASVDVQPDRTAENQAPSNRHRNPGMTNGRR